MAEAKHLLGEWRQIKPSMGRDEVFLRFEPDGRLIWTIESPSPMSVELTWSVSGDTLRTWSQSGPAQEFRFRFVTPTRMVVERANDPYVYERCG